MERPKRIYKNKTYLVEIRRKDSFGGWLETPDIVMMGGKRYKALYSAHGSVEFTTDHYKWKFRVEDGRLPQFQEILQGNSVWSRMVYGEPCLEATLVSEAA